MLKELREYNNLGTPSFFYQLFCCIKDNPDQIWTLHDVRSLFYNKIIDGRSIFDGCFEIAIHVKFLVRDNGYLYLNDSLKSSFIFNIRQLADRFNELLFLSLKEDRDFFDIFSSNYLSYDIIYKSMQIDNSAFGFKFANVKQLLLDFDVIRRHPTPEINSYIINGRYKKLFDKTLLPEIKKRRIGVQELHDQMSQQQIYGEEAEKFVIAFEAERLNGKQVDWVAEYIANEGYDIASYDKEIDTEHNRFIEVKSYDGLIPYFYWSKNEYQVAKQRKDKYWIYLINRTRMNDNDYIPEMIQNPYIEIIEKENWSKDVENIITPES